MRLRPLVCACACARAGHRAGGLGGGGSLPPWTLDIRNQNEGCELNGGEPVTTQRLGVPVTEFAKKLTYQQQKELMQRRLLERMLGGQRGPQGGGQGSAPSSPRRATTPCAHTYRCMRARRCRRRSRHTHIHIHMHCQLSRAISCCALRNLHVGLAVKLNVKVPENYTPGAPLNVTLANGRTIPIRPPDGVKPGQCGAVNQGQRCECRSS